VQPADPKNSKRERANGYRAQSFRYAPLPSFPPVGDLWTLLIVERRSSGQTAASLCRCAGKAKMSSTKNPSIDGVAAC